MKRLLLGAASLLLAATPAMASTLVATFSFLAEDGMDHEIIAEGSTPTSVWLCTRSRDADAKFAYRDTAGVMHHPHMPVPSCTMLTGVTFLQVFNSSSRWSGSATIYIPD